MTRQSLAGTWYLQRMLVNEDTVLDSRDPTIMLGHFMQQLRLRNPDYTATDSLQMMSSLQKKHAEIAHIFMRFHVNGTCEMPIFSHSSNRISDSTDKGTYTLLDGGRKIVITKNGEEPTGEPDEIAIKNGWLHLKVIEDESETLTIFTKTPPVD